jgi:hypothetical protein
LIQQSSSCFSQRTDPATRLTATAALEHPAFAEHHNEATEPVCGVQINAFDEEHHTIEEWKALLFDEIRQFRHA